MPIMLASLETDVMNSIVVPYGPIRELATVIFFILSIAFLIYGAVYGVGILFDYARDRRLTRKWTLILFFCVMTCAWTLSGCSRYYHQNNERARERMIADNISVQAIIHEAHMLDVKYHDWLSQNEDWESRKALRVVKETMDEIRKRSKARMKAKMEAVCKEITRRESYNLTESMNLKTVDIGPSGDIVGFAAYITVKDPSNKERKE